MLLAALVAFQLAQGQSVDQLSLIGGFFTALGDNLILIAARRALPACGGEQEDASAAQAAD